MHSADERRSNRVMFRWAAAMVLLLMVSACRAAWADDIGVQVTAAPSLRGGTVYARMAFGTSGPWQKLGVLTGLPIADMYMLENGHSYEIKVEKPSFFSIEWGRTEFEVNWENRNVTSRSPFLHVFIKEEPPAANVSNILLEVVLPILIVVAFVVWRITAAYRVKEKQLNLELQQSDQTSASRATSGGLTHTDRTPLPTDLKIGPYRVVQKIGTGGMATVYAVTDAGGARYALKVPHREAIDDPDYVARFNREIKICVGLVHPNIVRTFDAGTYAAADGKVTPYMVMELVNGTELVDLLRVRAKSGQTPDLNFAYAVAEGVLTGLVLAHERGIIHRDIKPSNIMVTENRVIKIMDFGIARMDHSKTITKAAGMLGTPEYMAPEQVSNPTKVDHRADLYSTGVMLYSLVTYQLPYETRSDEIWALMMEKLTERVVSPGLVNPEVPMAFDGFIMRMMEINAEDRFPTSRAALNALKWVGAHPNEMLPESTFEQPV